MIIRSMANLYCFVFRRRGRWWGLTWQLRSANADERILGCTQIQGRFKVSICLVSRKSREKLLWWSPLRCFATPGYSSTVKKLKAGLHLRLRHQQNKHTQKHLLVLKKNVLSQQEIIIIKSLLSWLCLCLRPGHVNQSSAFNYWLNRRRNGPSYAQHQLEWFKAKDGL